MAGTMCRLEIFELFADFVERFLPFDVVFSGFENFSRLFRRAEEFKKGVGLVLK